MRKLTVFLCVITLVYGIAANVNAILWDRGGGLIYDDVLNVTWLQDANYAITSNFSSSSTTMTWYEATYWATNLEYYDSVRDVFWTDWRLPNTKPVNGSNYIYEVSHDGSTDDGYNISAPGSAYPGSTGSEMAYMYYNNLGNVAHADINGNSPQFGWSSTPNASFIDGYGNALSFQNLLFRLYWSGTEYEGDTYHLAWYFNIKKGNQDKGTSNVEAQAWAVRDGDVGAAPVPVPDASIMLLLGSSLMGLAVFSRKSKRIR